MTWAMRLRDLASTRRAPELAAALGMLLALPTLAQGLLLDDHLLLAATRRGDPAWARFDFNAAGSIVQLREQGSFGWWAAEDLRLTFMRPLSALTHALDFSVWPEAVGWMHVENVLLYGLVILAVGRLLQRLLGPGPLAGLACLVFAIDEVHATAVMWISARNTLLAALFGVLAILAHLRWRRPAPGEVSSWPFAWLGPLCLGLALLSGEAGIAGLGLVIAWSLTHERDWKARVVPLLPYLLVVVAWRVAYTALGYGAHASGLYIDPLHDPLAMLSKAALQVPGLGFAALALPVADVLTGDQVASGLAALGFLVLVWALAPLWNDRNARCLALALVFAALPFTATAATSRVMLILGPASAGLFALAWQRRHEPAFAGRVRRGSIYFMAGCQLVLAPLLFVPMSFAALLAEPPHRAIAATLPEPTGPTELVVLLNVPLEINALYPQAIRENAGARWPAHVYLLFAGFTPVEVERLDEHTLELHAERGWAEAVVDRLSRDWTRESFAVGDHVTLERARIEILDVESEGRPTRVRVRFEDRLDDLAIFGFEGSELVRWQPEIGEVAVFQASLTSP